MATLLYMYDPETFEYAGTREATVLSNGREVTEAAFTTTVAVPEVAEGYAARWTGTEWEVLEDHRQHYDETGVKQGGTAYWLPDEGDNWQSDARYMTELGPLPEGAVTEKPEQTLEDVKAEKLDALKSDFEAAMADSTLSITSSVGFAINANTTASDNIAKLITYMEGTGVESVEFMAFDNTTHAVTVDELKTMQIELAAWVQALYAYKWQVRSQIEAAETVEDVQAIVIDFTQAVAIYESMQAAE